MATKQQIAEIHRSRRCSGALMERMRKVIEGVPLGKGKPPPFGPEAGLVTLDARGIWTKVTALGKALLRYDDAL